jgi:MYXO-CTERM domain-containing protein
MHHVARSLARIAAVAAPLALLFAPNIAAATPPLYTPFPCGTTYTVSQGHNTGSHTDYGSWAWDIGIGVGDDVAAPADGVIRSIRMDSTSFGCSSAYANDANYVVVDFMDGTEALFLHLQAGSSSLQVGDPVKQGDVVGKVGESGWICGAHLHFQIQQTCMSDWWCPSIPSSFVDYGDPGYGTVLESNNCPPLDPCPPLDGGETIVDDWTTCFEKETSYWWTEPTGYDDKHHYTFAIDAAESDTVGTWWLEVEVAGTYQIDAYIPDGAQTQNARYFADPGTGRVELATIDQAASSGWVSLGELAFTEGSDRYVELGDATGEDPSSETRVTFDALRFSYIAPEGTGGGGTGGSGSGAGGVGGSGVGGGPGGDASSGAGASEADPDGETPAEGSCGCRTAGGSRSPAGFVLLGLAFALARRRRRSLR